MERKLNVALIGCGSVGRGVHLPILKKNSRVKVVAVVDTSEANLSAAERFVPQARAFDNTTDFFQEQEVDAVILATPPETHAEFAKTVIASGTPIYLEKPLARDLAAGEDLVSCARSANVTAMLGFNFRFNPIFAQLRKAIADNLIGKTQLVRTTFSITKEHAESSGWRSQSRNGVIMELGSHHFDLLHYLFKRPITTISSSNSENQIFLTSATLDMLIDEQIPVQSHFSFNGSLENRIEIFGTQGNFIADRYRSLCLKKNAKVRSIFDFIDEVQAVITLPRYLPRFMNRCLSPWGEPSYKLALDAFFEATRQGVPVKPDFEDGLSALILVEAAEQAIRENTTVKPNC